MTRVLVFGAHGQVARALAEAPGEFKLDFAGRDRLDLAAPSPDIAGLIAAAAPAAVINASAYTAVDRAEQDAEACARLNCDAPAAMGAACAARGIPFVHFSTDYVFDGEKGAPYDEGDARAPLNVYGRTKADGEAALEAMIADGGRIVILRSAWVFAPGGAGFLGAMLRLAVGQDEVAVVADQWGSPTPASSCADAAITLARALLDHDPAAPGVFHAAGRDHASWADFAEAIFAVWARQAQVRRITAADYPVAARRPRDTRLSSAKLAGAFGWRAPSLDEALRGIAQ